MSVRQPGFRLVGTWDDEGNLLFSHGFKNFSSRTPCHQCQEVKAMMHRYGVAKKGVMPVVSPEVFCSVDCYGKWTDTEAPKGQLQPEPPA